MTTTDLEIPARAQELINQHKCMEAAKIITATELRDFTRQIREMCAFFIDLDVGMLPVFESALTVALDLEDRANQLDPDGAKS